MPADGRADDRQQRVEDRARRSRRARRGRRRAAAAAGSRTSPGWGSSGRRWRARRSARRAAAAAPRGCRSARRSRRRRASRRTTRSTCWPSSAASSAACDRQNASSLTRAAPKRRGRFEQRRQQTADARIARPRERAPARRARPARRRPARRRGRQRERLAHVVRHDDDGLAHLLPGCGGTRVQLARVTGSSAPNGSSISRIGGSAASARATPTRCRWPPDSSVRPSRSRSRTAPSPMSSSSSRTRAADASASSQPSRRGTTAMFSATRHVRKEPDFLQHVADAPAQIERIPLRVSRVPTTTNRPASGSSSRLTSLRMVLLPAPLRPTSATVSPRSMREIHALQDAAASPGQAHPLEHDGGCRTVTVRLSAAGMSFAVAGLEARNGRQDMPNRASNMAGLLDVGVQHGRAARSGAPGESRQEIERAGGCDRHRSTLVAEVERRRRGPRSRLPPRMPRRFGAIREPPLDSREAVILDPGLRSARCPRGDRGCSRRPRQ